GLKFGNDWSLTEKEEQTLLAWLRNGAPKDAEKDPLVAAAKLAALPEDDATAPRWELGEPDLVLTLPSPAFVRAEGTMDYQYTIVQPNLEEDMWVTAAEVIPTDRGVTHHALIFIAYPSDYIHLQRDERVGLDGYFAA